MPEIASKKERWALISNPECGKGKKRHLTDQVARELREAGQSPEILWTERPGHAEELASLAVNEGFETLVVCGGDGTIHEVVNGLLASRPGMDAVKLGIVPLGTCNDFARALQIPGELPSNMRALLSGKARPIDIGLVGERCFLTVATLGFDTEVARYVAAKRRLGRKADTLAYLFGILITLFRYHPIVVRLSGDAVEFEGPIFLAAIGNITSYGGGIKIVPGAVLDDGYLNLCLVRHLPSFEVVRMLPRVFSGKHIGHPKVSMHIFSRMEVMTSEPAAIWADGEPVATTPAVFRIMPQALRVLVP